MTRTKRVMTVLAALAVAVTLAVPALAMGAIDMTMPGSVTLELPGKYEEDLAGTTVAVDVYKVADVDANGVFTLSGAFSSLADDAAAWNGGILNSQDQLEKLLEAAKALVVPPEEEEPAEGEAPAEPFVPAAAADIAASVTAENGRIDLAALGLYLLVPQQTETTQWIYTFSPILLAVPSVPEREADPEGGIPAEGDWLYDVVVEMKAERESRLTGIVIEKTLREYNATLGQTSFLFEVTAEQDGKIAYSNVVSLTFAGTGTQSVTVEGLPVGAHVTVTEVYSGGSYVPADGRVSVDIPELPLPAEGDYTRVPFTNTYTNERIPDGSVVNRYVYNGTGWEHQGEEAGQ